MCMLGHTRNEKCTFYSDGYVLIIQEFAGVVLVWLTESLLSGKQAKLVLRYRGEHTFVRGSGITPACHIACVQCRKEYSC